MLKRWTFAVIVLFVCAAARAQSVNQQGGGSATAPQSGPGAPSNPCSPALGLYINTTNGDLYTCPASGGSWVLISHTSVTTGTPPYSTKTITASPMTILETTHNQGIYAFPVCLSSSSPEIGSVCAYTRNSSGDLVISYTIAPTEIDVYGATGGFANPLTAASQLIGSSSTSTSPYPATAITLGSGLTMTGTTLSASGSGSSILTCDGNSSGSGGTSGSPYVCTISGFPGLVNGTRIWVSVDVTNITLPYLSITGFATKQLGVLAGSLNAGVANGQYAPFTYVTAQNAWVPDQVGQPQKGSAAANSGGLGAAYTVSLTSNAANLFYTQDAPLVITPDATCGSTATIAVGGGAVVPIVTLSGGGCAGNLITSQPQWIVYNATSAVLMGNAGNFVSGASNLTTTNAIPVQNGTTGTLTQSTCTIASGTITCPGTFNSGTGSGVGGALDLAQGTLPSLGTTAVSLFAPTSVTSYGLVMPGAAPAANQILVAGAPSSGISTFTWQNQSGGGTTYTAGTGGTTQYYLVKQDTTNPSNVITVAASDNLPVVGVAATTVSATASVSVLTGNTSCVAANAITAGHVLIVGTVTPGQAADSGQTTMESVQSNFQIVGVALANATSGSTFNCRIFPQGLFGSSLTGATGTLPTVNGGSGISSPTAHSLMISEGASAFNLITAATAGNIVIDQGSGVDWAAHAVSGDATLSSAGLLTVTQVEGAAIPASAAFLTTNSSKQLIAGTVLPGANGGTGIANTGFTLTVAGNVAFTGAFNPTIAIPSTGTYSLVPGTEATLGANTFTAGQVLSLTSGVGLTAPSYNSSAGQTVLSAANGGAGGMYEQLQTAGGPGVYLGVNNSSGSDWTNGLARAATFLANNAKPLQLGSNATIYYTMQSNGHQQMNTTTDPGANIWLAVNGDAKVIHKIAGGTVPTVASGGGGTGQTGCADALNDLGQDESGCITVGSGTSTNSIVINFGQPYTNPPTCHGTDTTTMSQGVQCVSVLGGLASGTYTSGITATGSTNQTCTLTAFNGSGSSATATVALTGTNTIAGGTALVVTANGTGYTANPTSATAGNGTATCSGTATVSTVRNAVQMTLNGFSYITGAAANFTAADNVTWLVGGH